MGGVIVDYPQESHKKDKCAHCEIKNFMYSINELAKTINSLKSNVNMLRREVQMIKNHAQNSNGNMLGMEEVNW